MGFMRFLLTTQDSNTRFVYLLQGSAIAVSILAVTWAFITTPDPVAREGFSTMMMALLGGGSLSTLVKGYSKRVGGSTDNGDTPNVGKC